MDGRYSERMQAMLGECEVSPTLLDGMPDRMRRFVEPFAASLPTAEQRGYAADYVAGLCAPVERKTCETIAYFHDRNRQGLQRFIGSLPWDHRPLIGELARQVGATLGEPDGILVLDPSGFAKKGTESVGVARQWNGRLGKVDNCQVGVYLAYVSRREQALVDFRLYLPQAWARDRKRRKKCRVPKSVKFATKLEQAREMVHEQAAVLPHTWIVGDDEFGRSTQFRRDLRADGRRYLLAVPSDTLIRDLAAEPPPYRGFGKRPQPPFVRVDAWRASLPPTAWRRVEVRDGEKRSLTIDVACTPVRAVTERRHDDADELLVVTRRTEDSGAVVYDYWLSNAAPDTPPEELARAAQARNRIEQCFQRGKSETGLADYETRTWYGWHHHQTLALLAGWFLVGERLRGEKNHACRHLSATTTGLGRHALRSRRPPRLAAIGPRHANPTRAQRTRPLPPLEIPQPLTTPASSATTIE